jgi:hypothetical protein
MISNEQKAQIYGQLLNDHTRLHNQINEIKGQNLELNDKQRQQIRELEQRQFTIMRQINQLMS